MKPELDQLFLAGINHVLYHGTCYSPSDAPWPGWLFYASTQYNERNALWRDLGEGLNAYITRCQSLLQQGQPDNDVLVYWPVYDLWHNADSYDLRFGMHDAKWIVESPAGKVAQALIDRGIGFDFISDAQLNEVHADYKGGIQTGSNLKYGVLLVPRTSFLPLSTLNRLLTLVRQRAKVIFIDSLPSDVAGYKQLPEQRALFQAELAKLQFSKPDQTGLQMAILGKTVIGLMPLSTLSLPETFDGSCEPTAIQGLRVARRHIEGRPVYFITNQSAKPFNGWAEFHGTDSREFVFVIRDPLSGKTGKAAKRIKDGTDWPEIFLQLQPGASIFLEAALPTDDCTPWSYTEDASGAIRPFGPWHVTFLHGGPELPPAYKTTDLKSWTEQGGEAERFAGTARYETEFEVPAGVAADEWQLDLGDVRETARVFVNGQQVDLLWSLPFRTHIGAFLKPGKNTLAIEVTNLSANRIRDLDKRSVVWKNFYEINFVNPHYEKLDASTWPIMPSGLIGPVTLTPLKKFDPGTEKK
jgi:hypothetical protein